MLALVEGEEKKMKIIILNRILCASIPHRHRQVGLGFRCNAIVLSWRGPPSGIIIFISYLLGRACAAEWAESFFSFPFPFSFPSSSFFWGIESASSREGIPEKSLGETNVLTTYFVISMGSPLFFLSLLLSLSVRVRTCPKLFKCNNWLFFYFVVFVVPEFFFFRESF